MYGFLLWRTGELMNSEETKEEHLTGSGETDRKVTRLCKSLRTPGRKGVSNSCSFSPILCVFQEVQRLLHNYIRSWEILFLGEERMGVQKCVLSTCKEEQTRTLKISYLPPLCRNGMMEWTSPHWSLGQRPR